MKSRTRRRVRFEQLENRELLNGKPVAIPLSLDVSGEEGVSVQTSRTNGAWRSDHVNGNNVFFGRPDSSTETTREQLLLLNDEGEWRWLSNLAGQWLDTSALTVFDDKLVFGTSASGVWFTDGIQTQQ